MSSSAASSSSNANGRSILELLDRADVTPNASKGELSISRAEYVALEEHFSRAAQTYLQKPKETFASIKRSLVALNWLTEQQNRLRRRGEAANDAALDQITELRKALRKNDFGYGQNMIHQQGVPGLQQALYSGRVYERVPDNSGEKYVWHYFTFMSDSEYNRYIRQIRHKPIRDLEHFKSHEHSEGYKGWTNKQALEFVNYRYPGHAHSAFAGGAAKYVRRLAGVKHASDEDVADDLYAMRLSRHK
jgi:hypothetical protein